MTERFGAGAARLCNAASTLLAWRPDEFWSATPRELALAIAPSDEVSASPDKATIEALRRRFPDE